MDPADGDVRTDALPFEGDLLDVVHPWLRRRGGFLLESSGPAVLHARWSFAGVPRTWYVLDGGRLVRVAPDGSRDPVQGAPLDVLRDVLPAPEPRPEGVPPFPGGWLLYAGFEAVRLLEDVPVGEAPTPDLAVGRVDRVLAHDRRDGRLVLCAAGDDADAALDDLRHAVADPPPRKDATLRPVELSSSHDPAAYADAVRHVQEHVRAGDVFQANVAQRFTGPTPGDPVAVYDRLRAVNPGGFNAYLDLGDARIASSSPERLVRLTSERVDARPIAGTRPRGTGSRDDALVDELRSSDKEAAEHAMIVDLYRNDVSRVAEPGTVRVDPYRSVERYARVSHLTSNVVGRPRPDVGPVDVFEALFPGGSITGAPKVRATKVIADVEPGTRGPYTGSLGWVSRYGMDLNILIRTLVFREGRVSLPAGGGVVADSDPRREFEESLAKAQAMVEAVTSSAGGRPAVRYEPGARWTPPEPDVRREARVLLVDHVDSFVHNLAHHLGALGATVRVVRHDALDVEDAVAWDPTHVVLSPGPGRPDEFAGSRELLDAWDGPVLGVCLGHQILALHHGGDVGPAPAVVHGKASRVVHGGAGVLAGVPSPFPAARYHSLHVGDPPPGFEAVARTEDGLLMGVRHRDEPRVGLAFHPESVLTASGPTILANVLDLGRQG